MSSTVAQGALHVLVVDDEESARSFAEAVLVRGGYQVAVASNGPDALKIVEQRAPFDLYVLDVAMPQMRGDELSRRLRQRVPDARILYFTGHSDQLFAGRSTLWEHEAFIEKPVTVRELLEAVSLLLFGHTQGPPPSSGPSAA